jgi:hypothetical protein
MAQTLSRYSWGEGGLVREKYQPMTWIDDRGKKKSEQHERNREKNEMTSRT